MHATTGRTPTRRQARPGVAAARHSPAERLLPSCLPDSVSCIGGPVPDALAVRHTLMSLISAATEAVLCRMPGAIEVEAR
ncbi:hypothetical protein GCM10009839_93530 [Catenulispora yoronensis]|uniref:Uncharacterized protein n=1 Tax=Catenulispora yoronensis TaxID=450799 RepID=A0ABP5H795_9ACTN